MSDAIEFEAIVDEVKVKQTASIDREIRIVLKTSDMNATELQKYIAENSVKVSVEL